MSFNNNTRPAPRGPLWLLVLLGGASYLEAQPSGLDGAGRASRPGSFTIRCEAGTVSVSNRALCMSWKVTPRGLESLSALDVTARKTLLLTGEVFQVVLTNGEVYRASALTPQAGPVVSELSPDAGAARLSGRIPGRRVELPLRSADRRLEVLWQAVCADDANYVRQQVLVRALDKDLPLQETVWLDTLIPGARTAGIVDGSPMVAGEFFFGLEDPHALNLVERPSQPVGAWTPGDLTAGRRRTRTWSVDASLLNRGTNEIVFQYERGPHRLDIWRVALLENGREIAHDAHHGYTGTSQAQNRYRLGLPAIDPGSRYELAAEIGTDPDFRLPPGRELESYGTVRATGGDGRAVCRLIRNTRLPVAEPLKQSFVLGVAPPGGMRRAFLRYLERERAHPYRPYLHYNSWYDISWPGVAMNESNCLAAVRSFGENLIKPFDVVMDGMVFDDGWDDPKTLWHFHQGFPRGFEPQAALCRQYHTRLGVWLSPFGGYGEAKAERLKFASAQGYETNATGFSLAGPRYFAAFKQACVDMIRRYGVNHFKFDGIASGMYANGPGPGYLLDTEGMRRLMLELRAEEPGLYINLTTGSWPSPFWLHFADSVWRQGGDMGFTGRGNKQQQWITYRDQEVFRNIVAKGPLYPLNALMTQGVSWSRHGSAAEAEFNSRGFRDDVRGFFGSGTSLQELYLQPQRLSPSDWRVLAEAARWSRANADVLVDSHWVGGDPGSQEIYGYASWTPRKGILMLRNPDDQEHEFALDVGRAFELAGAGPARFTLKSAWAEDAGKPPRTAAAGQPLPIRLKPFEIVVLDAIPD